MHKGTFPRANCSARKRTVVHLRAETLRAEKIGAFIGLDTSDIPVSAILGLYHNNLEKVQENNGSLQIYRIKNWSITTCVEKLLEVVFFRRVSLDDVN